MTTRNNQSSKRLGYKELTIVFSLLFENSMVKFYTLKSPKIIKAACNRKNSK